METRNCLFLLVLGVAATINATPELGLEGLKPSELKEIEKEIAAGNVPPNYTAEKPKRLAPKLANADSPNFNQLQPISSSHLRPYTNEQPAYTAQQPAYTAQQAAYNPVQPAYTSPLRYIYNNQYVPNNQFLPYLQNPQIASQIAAQYAYQPAAHLLQTPTQIQYVSPPSYQSAPTPQFKTLPSKTSTPSAASAATGTPSQATSQVLLPSNMPYQQQPFLMYLFPQQPQQQYYYPGQQQMLFIGAHNPLLNLYGGQQRFGLQYTSPAAANQQLAYLTLPGAQQQQQLQQQQLQQTLLQQQDSSEIQKQQQQQQPINVQENSQQQGQTFGLRTKA